MRTYSSKRQDTPMWEKLKYLRAMRRARKSEPNTERLLRECVALLSAKVAILSCELELTQSRSSQLEALIMQLSEDESLDVSGRLLNSSLRMH